MGVLNLLALAYLATIALLVVIYLFRKKRKTIPVSSFIPWRDLKEGTVRTRFFLADALFFLQIIILSLLALSLARPYITSTIKGITGKDLILLVDTSASMQTREGESTRFELAKAEALKVVERMGMTDKAQLISMHSSPLIVSEPIGDKWKLNHLIQNLEVTDTTTNLEEGLSLALSLLRRNSLGEVHVFTDRVPPEINTPQASKIKFFTCGKAPDNVAIVGLDVYQDMFKEYSEREGYVTVRNMGTETKTVLLKGFLDHRPLMEETVELTPQEDRTVRIEGISGPGLLRVELHPEDAMPLDNQAFAIIRPKKTIKVLVVTPGGPLEKELGKVDKVVKEAEFLFASPKGYGQLPLKDFAICLFHKYVPEALPDINSLFIFPPQDNKFFPVEGWFRNSEIIDWEHSHPIMGHLDYIEDIWLTKALAFKNMEGFVPVVRASAGDSPFPVVIAGLVEGKRVAVLGFDLAEFSFTRAKDIPVLIMFLNILQWLDPEGTAATQVKTGKNLTFNLKGDSKELSLTNPKGKTVKIDVSGDTVVIKDINHVGEYHLKGKGIERRFVANLFDREESDIRPSSFPKKGIPFEEASVTPFSLTEKQELGKYLLILVLLLLLAEWVLYHLKARARTL
ncbi:MAG TPA: vWA domain-containing protein [Candidatus Tripitaka californicus]|uniref:vWA domain-containing protein n=2 Tax=Candidatus Tripitaka californicus TaxID=3367616 RepID=UPI0040282B07|nr:VWA domain-containing protein [Planctomycetota bacterium]